MIIIPHKIHSRYVFDDCTTHLKHLAKLAKRAEKVAGTMNEPGRDKIRNSLRDDGVSKEIDVVVSRIMNMDQKIILC